VTFDSSQPIPGGVLRLGPAPSDASGYQAGSVSAPSAVVVPSGEVLCAQIG
jgi:hypothetical protein